MGWREPNLLTPNVPSIFLRMNISETHTRGSLKNKVIVGQSLHFSNDWKIIADNVTLAVCYGLSWHVTDGGDLNGAH